MIALVLFASLLSGGLLFGAGECVELDAVEHQVGVLAGVYEGEVAGASFDVDRADLVEAIPSLAMHVVPQLQLAGGSAFGGHQAILLAEFSELVGGEVEVDHDGAAERVNASLSPKQKQTCQRKGCYVRLQRGNTSTFCVNHEVRNEEVDGD